MYIKSGHTFSHRKFFHSYNFPPPPLFLERGIVARGASAPCPGGMGAAGGGTGVADPRRGCRRRFLGGRMECASEGAMTDDEWTLWTFCSMPYGLVLQPDKNREQKAWEKIGKCKFVARKCVRVTMSFGAELNPSIFDTRGQVKKARGTNPRLIVAHTLTRHRGTSSQH